MKITYFCKGINSVRYEKDCFGYRFVQRMPLFERNRAMHRRRNTPHPALLSNRMHPHCRDTLIEATQGTFVSTQAHDPLMRIRPTRYGILGDQRTAVIEMAEINGLTTLSPIKRNPMKTSTYGTGELIKDALEKGFRRFIIGIGGTSEEVLQTMQAWA